MNNFFNSTSTVPEFVGSSEIGDTIGMCKIGRAHV